MGRFLIIISVLTILFSCKQDQLKDKFIFKPVPESFDKYSTQTFNEPFFNEEHYSYCEWVKVDKNERFSGVPFVDASTGKQETFDTTKYLYSAEVFVIERNDTTFMRTCKTTLADTTLNFVLNDDPFSQRNTELEIVKFGDNLKSNFVVTAIPTDSSYKLPTFIVLTQNILLDKQKYEKGNNLEGKISLTIKAFYPMINITDTIKVFGLLKTTVY